jgi:hypothetical protein
MNIRQPSLLRDALGFTVGGLLAAVFAGLAFVAFVPLGDVHDGRNHAPEAFMLTVLVMLICGGFIGRRGFSAEALSDFLPSIAGTYLAVFGLPLLAGLSLTEALPFAGFASVGVVASVAASLLFLKFVPVQLPDDGANPSLTVK